MVHLDPNKRYYISVLPGDAGNDFIAGAGAPVPVDPKNPSGPTRQFDIAKDCGLYSDPQNAANWAPGSGSCGHGMGGANIAAGATAVDVKVEETPFPTTKVAVFVFEDDFPLNGENDAGGGVDALAVNEHGLGGFEVRLFDDAGGPGDATGQMTYDMFNYPLSNSLAGTPDPLHNGQDACPITKNPDHLIGMVVTCPHFEVDGVTESPLEGQVVISYLMPGRYGVQATEGADRIARGEEWLQTNTLDGQKAHDSFIKIGGPAYFQEFGPGGYHVLVGFANPAIINARGKALCAANPVGGCQNTLDGTVTTSRMSRTPDQRLYSSGNHASFGFTQCYASLGDPDEEDFAFAKCDADGHFHFANLPDGNWRVTLFDQWNDQIVDGLSTPVALGPANRNAVLGDAVNGIPVQQWHTNLYTRSYFDTNNDGVSSLDSQGNPTEAGLTLLPTNIRFRDGSYSNRNNTDLNGYAGFNEIFPLFNWYVIETDTTRFKQTGVHVVYDAGGPADGAGGASSNIGDHLANTNEAHPVPAELRVPGAVYCADADCAADNLLNNPNGGGPGGSTGRIDPPSVTSEAWQGFIGQNEFIEFGKKPFATGENGGIHGEVIYASTRPFDDPGLLIHTSWTPDVPNVTINLYKEGTAADGTTSLTLMDTTTTTSWDDFAQGVRSDGNPNMNCPGQDVNSLYFFTLKNSPEWLNPGITLPNNSQYKCYDGFAQFNQVQPAPYDGYYHFPSVTAINNTTGRPTKTNCKACIPDPDSTDKFYAGTPMLPAGKYVVEMIVPPGYELVKEEDKNILIGDNYIAPVTQQFAGLGNVFILPDQAAVGAAYNPNNPQQPTQNLGSNTFPRHEGDTGSIEEFWPCVGQTRIVPDFISLFPGSAQAAPFAGATRNLCDRKEVTLEDQTAPLAKFWVFSSTHVAAHFTGIILDDFSSEFDPFSPQFGEKFAVPNLPISFKDFAGIEISRTYADQWGLFNGMNYSTWEVNPPNPTGYAPTMMVTCMNDPGPIPGPNNTMITDPLYNPAYSQFCYEIPFMPGQTQYMDTPVVPTAAFAQEYNLPDCAYPDTTPAVAEVDGDGIGPWVDVPSGQVSGIDLTSPGSGYTSLPTVSVSAPGAGGTQATATVTDLNIVSIAVANGGSGYTTAPAVTIQGGGGAGASATATIASGKVTAVTVTTPGAGYTSVPNVRIAVPTTPRSLRAQATASMGVNTVAVTSGGSGYTAATATLSGTATANARVSTSHQTLTITALGDQVVRNHAYSGPSATTAPYNQKWITRHYGFGTQGTGPAQGTVSIGGVSVPPANITTWNDTTIVLNVPAGVPNCTTQQRGATLTQCGQLVITSANTAGTNAPSNAKSSVDAVSVTIGGKPPVYVGPENATNNAIQSAIDSAKPGDLLMVRPGTYNEMLLMWKPLRLQGVAAASVTVNANTHPSGRIDPWRRKAACLFGLALDGGAVSPQNKYDPSGSFTCDATMQGQVDPIPLEPLVGWDPTLNGNIAELLQEPTLLGAYEGAAITVLAKGVRSPDANCTANGVCIPLTASVRDCAAWPSNFLCNPASIDGISFTNSSQGGGGIFLHGWNHNMEVSNNRVHSNAGTLSGGITVGQPETTDGIVVGTQELAFGYNNNVNVHNNYVTENAAYGDELNSTTPMSAGGVTFCTGADHYKFNHNWVCGNLSTGDGGGLVQFGLVYGGNISNNTIIFNQSNNPTIPTNGGGITVMGAPPDGPFCENATIDQDCPPSLTDGAGPGLVIDSNLILGNTAESGSGGGLRLQNINGTEVALNATTPGNWYDVTVTNNIIANNVAGWDGGGVSMQDALRVNFVNNTVVANDTTASAGVLFNAIGSANSNNPPPGCTPQPDPTKPQDPSCKYLLAPTNPQPAGLASDTNTPNLIASLPATVTCPAGNFPSTNPTICRSISYPFIVNDLFWQNRAFNIQVGGAGTGNLSQQNIVTLAPVLNQIKTGDCPTGATYWDLGVRGDANAAVETLGPQNSIVTSGYAGNGNLNPAAAGLVSQYCNGSRVPPENPDNLTFGITVPPGISDATLPNPVFSLSAAATVDEGNNWVNMAYGPLSLVNPVDGQTTLANYSLTGTSAAINTGQVKPAPLFDFFGTPRKTVANPVPDIGAVEFTGQGIPVLSLSASTIAFGSHIVGTSTTVTATLSNMGGGLANIGYSPLTNFARNGGAGTCGTTLAGGQSCTLSITFAPARTQATLTAAYSDTLTLSFASPATPTTLTLGLTGTGFQLLNPAALAFGNQSVGTTSAPQSVTLFNQGATALTVNPVALSGNQFVGLNFTNCNATLPITLAAGASCTVSVQFRPTSTGAKTGTLNVTVGGVAGGPFPAALTGTGTTPALAVVSFSAPSPAMTTNPATRAVKKSTITVTNTGTGSLTLTAAPTVTINSGTGIFAIIAPASGTQCVSGTVVAPSATCTIGVQYTPPGTGNAGSTGHVTLTDTGAATATQNSTPNFAAN